MLSFLSGVIIGYVVHANIEDIYSFCKDLVIKIKNRGWYGAKHEDLIVTVIYAYILLNRVFQSCPLDPTLFRDIKKFLEDLAAKKD